MTRTLALFLAVGAACAGAHAQTAYSYAGSPVAIPDSPDGTCGTEAAAQITVPDSFTVGSVSAAFYIAHSFQGDLTVALTHVATGRTVTLVDRPGYPGAGVVSYIGFGGANYGSASAMFQLTDLAAQTYDQPQVNYPGTSNVSGNWKPEQPLAAFAGESAAGAWKLSVRDCAGMDTGQIVGFRLTLTPSTGTGASCYANCDGNTSQPYVSVADLTCFLLRFAAGCSSPAGCYPNCDGSTQAPFLNVADFTCFLQKFAAGCTAP